MKTRSTTPEKTPHLTGAEAPLVMQYLQTVGTATGRTVEAAINHPAAHPHLVPKSATVINAAGRAAHEAATTPQSPLYEGYATEPDIISRTYDMMGLSGAAQSPDAAMAASATAPDSLEGHISDDEIAAARRSVEASYNQAQP